MKNKIQELFEKYTPEEIAEAFVFPSDLSESEEKESLLLLNEARAKARAAMTAEQKMNLQLLQLKFLMEDYVKSDKYDENYSFSSCLRKYIKLNYHANKDFAGDIHLKDTELSQILNNHRLPNENTVVRLEIHSSNVISASLWLKISQKEKEHKLKNNTELRKQQSKFVRNHLQLGVTTT
jgi:hypothetical protein